MLKTDVYIQPTTKLLFLGSKWSLTSNLKFQCLPWSRVAFAILKVPNNKALNVMAGGLCKAKVSVQTVTKIVEYTCTFTYTNYVPLNLLSDWRGTSSRYTTVLLSSVSIHVMVGGGRKKWEECMSVNSCQ